MKRSFKVLFALLCIAHSAIFAQSSAFGIKGGLTIGQQNWNNNGTSDNSLLFKYHGAAFVETVPSTPTSAILFAQLGYHTRGSAFRYRAATVNIGGTQTNVGGFTQEFVFNNVALQVGFKKRNVLGSEQAYYAVGFRAEYTVSNSLSDLNSTSYFYSTFPTKDYVQKFNYGLSLAGGYEFPFSELASGFVELSIHPDISKQYFQPAIAVNYRDPYSGTVITSLHEQSIRNITFELSVGFRFLRKVVYVDGSFQ